MSEYSEQYTVRDLKNMGEKNSRHVLGDEKFEEFEKKELNPKVETPATTKHVSHPHGTMKEKDKDKDDDNTKTKMSTSTKWAAVDDEDDKDKHKKKGSNK